MTKKEECKFCTEFISRINKMKLEIEVLRSQTTKMRITLSDNGLLEDVTSVSDLEAICVEQLEKWKDKSALEVFDKDDSKVIETLGNTLLRVRGGKVTSDNSKKAKKLTSEQLLDLVKQADKDNSQ